MVLLRSTIALCLAYGTTLVTAIPKFHTVNGHFYNGTVCPAVTRSNVQCPVMCVSDQQLCPPGFGPDACSEGLTLCADGTCSSVCSSSSSSVCSCPSQPGLVLKACKSTPFYVDIPQYNPKNMTLQQYERCSIAMTNSSSVMNTWANIDTTGSAMIWNVCNAPKGMNFPIRANTVIIYLTVYLAFFPMLCLWALYKHTREKNYNIYSSNIHLYSNDTPSPSNSNPKINDDLSIEKNFTEKVDMDSEIEDETEILQQKGFKKSIIGNSLMVYMGIVSVFWVIILLLLSLDYYGYVVRGTPYGLFYNSYDLSSKAFCVAWFLSTTWYLFINVARTKIKNYFRLQANFEDADYVQINKPRKVIQMHGQESNSGFVMPLLAKFETLMRTKLGFDTLTTTVPVMKEDGACYFEFQSTRYHYDRNRKIFKAVAVSDLFSMKPQSLVKMSGGLDTNTALSRLNALGPNFIEVKVPSFLQAIWEELTGFFYIYQLQILWCYFYLAYWQIGISDTCVILLAALIKVIVRLNSEKRVKKMAEHVDTCQVLRDQTWSTISTADLVPGDIIKAETHQIVPVDAVILSGEIVVDESSLTGEPLPIRKFPIRPSNTTDFDCQSSSGKINSLFAGTLIKQSSEDAIALVLKTRTDTDKGQLIQRILFPQPVSFIFNEQLKLVFCILLLWALVLLGFGAWWLGGTGMTAWFYGTICAAQVMNPLLPAILVVGQSVAAGRLKKKGVFCVDFPRILMAGKVQVFCFDKTGTLTEEGLEYYGVYPCNSSTTEFDDLYRTFDQLGANQQLLQLGLSSCHSVTMLDGDYVGNPVDIVMFKATGASITNKQGHDLIIPVSDKKEQLPTLEVIQRNEFQHARASMSIAVRDTTTGHVHVFCKGSFERIAEVSTRGVPQNYDQITSQSAREGCYVLGMAHRDMGILTEEQVSQLITNCSRDELESDLEFIGLVLFKNLLKKDTAAAITQIKQGDVRVVMITGDNILTGVCIGQQCGLVPPNTPIVIGDLASKADSCEQLVWTDYETDSTVDHVDEAIATGCEVALTGNAFRYLVENGTIHKYLFSTRIFARMTPVDKMLCVELLMEKAITAMCGDGGNDCGALRSAHVGIAMSEAEASVVSPFNTPNRSVQACVDLLIQGRSALATSFASYKYLIMYGETMATVKFCTFYYTMSFSQWNFILIDAFITVFCAFAVTQAGAAKKLSHHRPTARILGPEVLLSVLGQLWINAWFLIGSFIWLYTRDDFFRCREWDARATDASKWWLLGDSFEADLLTFIALFQFVNSAMVFNYGYIFRQRWYRNYLLMVVWAVFVAIVSYWELADPNRFGCLMRLNCGNPDVLESLGYKRPNFYIEPYNNPLGHNVLPREFRYKLWAYSIGNMLAVHVWERFVVLGPVRQWLRQRYPLKRLVLKL